MYIALAVSTDKEPHVALVRNKGIATRICDKIRIPAIHFFLASAYPEVVRMLEEDKSGTVLLWPEDKKVEEWLPFSVQGIYNCDPLFKVYCNLSKTIDRIQREKLEATNDQREKAKETSVT